MLQNVLIAPSLNKWYQIGTLVKGNQRNQVNSEAKPHTEEGQH